MFPQLFLVIRIGTSTSISVNPRILPSLHDRTHSKVEAWARWSARHKVCFTCDNKLTTKWIRDTSSNVLHAPKPDT